MVASRWMGPDVLVIGWIPFSFNRPQAASGYSNDLATKLLFQSGNPSPPIGFAGYEGFTAWRHNPQNPVGSKDYRAALYLQGVAAEFQKNAPPRVDCANYGLFPGYTPMRLFTGGVNVLGIFPQFAQYTPGTGPLREPVIIQGDLGSQTIELRYRAEFKVSRAPNAVARVLTGSWAPYAWCEVRYRFHSSGEVRVAVHGSGIPSQRLYIDWATPDPDSGRDIIPEYDMQTASAGTIAGFIKTLGWGCKPAPQGSLLTWRGRASSY